MPDRLPDVYESTYLSYGARQLGSLAGEGNCENCVNRQRKTLLTTQQFVTRKTQITPKPSRLHGLGHDRGAKGAPNRPQMGDLLLIADSS